jgi:hypothetical protein
VVRAVRDGGVVELLVDLVLLCVQLARHGHHGGTPDPPARPTSRTPATLPRPPRPPRPPLTRLPAVPSGSAVLPGPAHPRDSRAAHHRPGGGAGAGSRAGWPRSCAGSSSAPGWPGRACRWTSVQRRCPGRDPQRGQAPGPALPVVRRLPPARRGLRVSAGRGPDVVVLVTTRREKRWREPSSPAAGMGQGGWRGHRQRL